MANGYVDGKIDVKNKGAQEATIEWDGGNLSEHIGGTGAVGGADNEFRKLVGGILNVNKHDNDIADILKELLTGKTGGSAREDIDTEAGIAGVELTNITCDSFTITLENGSGVVDTLHFKGAGVADLIASMDTVADLGDKGSRFSIVDDGDGIIGTSNAFGDLVGGVVPKGGTQKINDLASLLQAALDGDERVELLNLADDQFTLNLYNPQKGTVDTIVFKGDDAAAAIEQVTNEDDGGSSYVLFSKRSDPNGTRDDWVTEGLADDLGGSSHGRVNGEDQDVANSAFNNPLQSGPKVVQNSEAAAIDLSLLAHDGDRSDGVDVLNEDLNSALTELQDGAAGGFMQHLADGENYGLSEIDGVRTLQFALESENDWNKIKNIELNVDNEDLGGIDKVVVTGFVDTRIQLGNETDEGGETEEGSTIDVVVTDAKRGEFNAADSNYAVNYELNVASNGSGWQNSFNLVGSAFDDTFTINVSDSEKLGSFYNKNKALDGALTKTVTELGDGNDTFDASGVSTMDNVRGDDGDDVIRTGGGDDALDGGADDDLLVGGAGNDTLTGGEGDDTLTGKDEDATPANQSNAAGFANEQNTFVVGSGNDVVTDFDVDAGGESSFDTLSFEFKGSAYELSSISDFVNFVDNVIENDGDTSTDALIVGDDLVLVFAREGDSPNGDPTDSVVLKGIIGDDLQATDFSSPGVNDEDPFFGPKVNVLYERPGTTLITKPDSVISVDPDEAFNTDSATISLTFNAFSVDGCYGLISKDAAGYSGDGNHFTAYIEDGCVVVRFQDGTSSYLVGAPIEANRDYDLQIGFENGRTEVYLDGELIEASDFTMDWTTNNEYIQVGAKGWASETGDDSFDDVFNGEITNVLIVEGLQTVETMESLVTEEAPDPENVVFKLDGPIEVETATDVINVGHSEGFETDEGTIAFTFNADTVDERMGIVSKDASGYTGGGNHFAAYVSEDGDLVVRFQDGEKSKELVFEDIEADTDYDVVVTFGDGNVSLNVNGEQVGTEAFDMNWEFNQEYLQVGANGWASETGKDSFSEIFDGTISDVVVLDEVVDPFQTDLFA